MCEDVDVVDKSDAAVAAAAGAGPGFFFNATVGALQVRGAKVKLPDGEDGFLPSLHILPRPKQLDVFELRKVLRTDHVVRVCELERRNGVRTVTMVSHGEARAAVLQEEQHEERRLRRRLKELECKFEPQRWRSARISNARRELGILVNFEPGLDDVLVRLEELPESMKAKHPDNDDAFVVKCRIGQEVEFRLASWDPKRQRFTGSMLPYVEAECTE